jgi:hypothetical protein
MRRLADQDLIELSWKPERQATRREAASPTVRWDTEYGRHISIPSTPIPVERTLERRAVKLTPLGAWLVRRLRPTLESGKRIRWASVLRTEVDR